jgi:hypothetical protein
VKLQESTDFMIDWGEGQHLRVHEGVAMATQVLRAGPLPVQLTTTSTTYMALGTKVPAKWLGLFEHAIDKTSVRVELHHQSRAGRALVGQTITLAPCEQGEHFHADVSVSSTLPVEEGDSLDALSAALYEAWRSVGELMSELQEEWVFPFLEDALVIEDLHRA